MTIQYVTQSMRQILPRAELRAQDRRSGAYPVRSKTGDRTRSGRNLVYFDDTRTVLFTTGTLVSPPTTFESGSIFTVSDLTSSLGFVTGNVDRYALDQFIPHHDQSQTPGPFNESKLFEQDENALVNSALMTGSAF